MTYSILHCDRKAEGEKLYNLSLAAGRSLKACQQQRKGKLYH
ncbi:hypothetical protein HMPREF9999_01280 [Alloprevotella sp. oral taxon 473 str. F0040]|nr:hypothetical protein HMPREF9999_01280 [Alloprevotella sp. oral taxon 473 str. F0040]